jgi:hypothetical protein
MEGKPSRLGGGPIRVRWRRPTLAVPQETFLHVPRFPKISARMQSPTAPPHVECDNVRHVRLLLTLSNPRY